MLRRRMRDAFKMATSQRKGKQRADKAEVVPHTLPLPDMTIPTTI